MLTSSMNSWRTIKCSDFYHFFQAASIPNQLILPSQLTIHCDIYPKTGQGGAYVTNNHYSVTSMSDFDSVLGLLNLQCGPSAERAVGSILERKTDIEIDGVIAGEAIQKCSVASLSELMDILAEHGVNANKLAEKIALK